MSGTKMSSPMLPLIDLRKGYPKAANLQHRRMAQACRQAASRLDAGTEASFPLQYCLGGGTSSFIRRLCNFLKRSYGSCCYEDGLLTTNGVSHGIELACGALTKPGDSVWMEAPSYFLAYQIFVDHGLRVHGVPTDAHGLDTDALARMLSSGECGPPPSLVYVIPSHTNPSATVLPLVRRKHLLSLAEEYKFVVLTDDVYHLLEWGPERLPRLLELDASFLARARRERADDADAAPAAPPPGGAAAPTRTASSSGPATGDADDDQSYIILQCEQAAAGGGGHRWVGEGRVISLGSFTKILAPGLRLGWAESSPALIKVLSSRGYIVSGGSVAPFASEVVSELLVEEEELSRGRAVNPSGAVLGTILRELVRDYAASAAALCAALRDAGCIELIGQPQGGMFAWCRLPQGITGAALLPVAERHGVVFLPGAVCAPMLPAATFERCIRLCFAYEDRDAIVEGVARLKAAVDEVQQQHEQQHEQQLLQEQQQQQQGTDKNEPPTNNKPPKRQRR